MGPGLLRGVLASLPAVSAWPGLLRASLRWLSVHTGVPVLVVAAIAVVVGFRLLKRTARFALEVAAITLALLAASELGWLRW